MASLFAIGTAILCFALPSAIPPNEVLYFEDDRDAIPERLVAYYEREVEFSRDRYEFKPCPVSYELVEQGVFTDVLHPASVYDLISFAASECVKRKLRMRVCESCGRWFALTGRITATYCNLPREGRETGCRGLAAVKKWTEDKKENEVFAEHRREYKRRFAWIRAGRIAADEFYTWSEQARIGRPDAESIKVAIAHIDAFAVVSATFYPFVRRCP